MNNYIDERMIPYRRPYAASENTRNTRVFSVLPFVKKAFVGAAKILAVIFLLLISTFGGESENSAANKNNVSVKRAAKRLMLCAAGALLVWGALVGLDYIISYATLLPVGLWILAFAVTVLFVGKITSK